MQNSHMARCLLFGLGGVGILYFSLPFAFQKAQVIREENSEAWKIAGMVSSLPENSLFFLPDEIYEDEALKTNLALNAQGWKTPVLRLQADPEDRTALAASFPARQAYELLLNGGVELNKVSADWTAPSRSAVNSHHSRQTGRNLEQERVANEKEDQPGFLFYGWYPYLPPGIYECRFDLRWSDVKTDTPLRLEAMADLGARSLGEQVLAEGVEQTVIQFEISEALQVEPRVYYGGSGSVSLREVSFTRIPALSLKPVEQPAP
jgi:hypothetical protein